MGTVPVMKVSRDRHGRVSSTVRCKRADRAIADRRIARRASWSPSHFRNGDSPRHESVTRSSRGAGSVAGAVQTGLIEHIHVARAAGTPMTALASAIAREGVGLAGDRYAARAGFWQDDRVSRGLTLVEAETLDALAADGISVAPGELRRNVTTRGIRLDALLCRHFWLGGVLCAGTEPCEPCLHLEQVTGKRLLRPLVHRGGLRARLL